MKEGVALSLPKGWEIKEFECCIDKVTYTKKIKRKEFLEKGNYPIISQEKDTINGYWDKSEDVFKVKKPIVIFGDHTKVIKYIDFDFVLGADGVKILKPIDKLDTRFLYYYLQNINLGDLGYARHYRLLKEIEINYPKSLKEQKQIVSILDKTFTTIDKAKANAEQNLKNAKELFESYLQDVFTNKGEDWEDKEFGSVITTLTDYHANGSYKVLKKNVELKDTEDYAWMIRSTDFENRFKKPLKYIDEHAYNFMSKSKVFGGEIIMSKIGNAGIVYLMPKIDRPVSLAMNLFLIRLNENIVLPNFIFRFLKSNGGETQIKKRVKGATTKTITKDNVRNIIISYPSIIEQKKIVKKLDTLQSQTKKLEAIYQQKIVNLEELKKSVLQKAFNGELTNKNNAYVLE